MYFEIGDYNALKDALYEMCSALSREQLPAETVFNSKLVANELLSNVLQHGAGKAVFRVRREGNELLICVRGEENYRPPETSSCASVDEESGRGLYLVDAYSDRRDYTEREGIRVFLRIRQD